MKDKIGLAMTGLFHFLAFCSQGNKDKNIEDVNDVGLILPTFEYHNQTWTWLDFLMALKKDHKRVLISQVSHNIP